MIAPHSPAMPTVRVGTATRGNRVGGATFPLPHSTAAASIIGINRTIAGGDATPEKLLAGVKRGVLITRMWYSRWLDPQAILATGLTRDGVFLIEDGQIVAPVNNFRYNESPVKMLKNADALTAAVTPIAWTDGVYVPALRTHDFNLASVSDAV
jgi:predicted Zn-dependent protease